MSLLTLPVLAWFLGQEKCNMPPPMAAWVDEDARRAWHS
jgi:hypothetical protein